MLKAIKKAALQAFPAYWGSPAGADYLYARLYLLLRLGLGGLFIYAGLIKLLDSRAFAQAVANFDLVPDQLVPLLAVGLPVLELLAGVGLIFEVRGSLGAITALLGLFLLALSYAVLLDLDIDCGCFPVAEMSARTGVKHALGRDLILVAAIAFIYRWRRRRAALAFDKEIMQDDQYERRKP
jgi:uncharacterized membrane protein YphA (DoxX/SURF4 family)